MMDPNRRRVLRSGQISERTTWYNGLTRMGVAQLRQDEYPVCPELKGTNEAVYSWLPGT